MSRLEDESIFEIGESSNSNKNCEEIEIVQLNAEQSPSEPEHERLTEENNEMDESEEEEEDDQLDLHSNRSVNTECISSEGGLDIESSSDDDVQVLNWDKHKIIKFGDVHSFEGQVCICKGAPNMEASLGLMLEMATITPTHDNYICIIDNIIRVYNNIFKNTTKVVNPFRLAFTDLFYRCRHEILFRSLCLSLNLPVQHSDEPFSKYGIPSERTPDLLIMREGVLYIIEVTATSSIEKAAQAKGMDIMGFESKYKKEIDMLNTAGVPNNYMPVFFDMNDPNSQHTIEQFNTLSAVFNVNTPYKGLLQTISRLLSGITNNFKNDLILPSAVLFSNVTYVKKSHSSMEFLYRVSKNKIPRMEYKEHVISPQVYNKITNDKQRFYWLLDNSSYTDNAKVVFVIDTNNHRPFLQKSIEGVTLNELRGLLDKNDNIGVMKHIKLKVGGLLVDCNSSEHGIHFFENISMSQDISQGKNNRANFDEIPTMAGHNEQPFMADFDLEHYKDIVKSYTSSNYHSYHYDENYEDQLIKAICDFDRDVNYDDPKKLPEGLLGNLKAVDIDIGEVMSKIIPNYISQNRQNDELPIRSLKMKSPFLLPLADLNESSYCELSYKNIEFISRLIEIIKNDNPYTELVLTSVLSENYKMYTKANPPTKKVLDLESERFNVSNRINRMQKEVYKKGTADGVVQLSKTKDPVFLEGFKELKKEYNKLTKELRVLKKKGGVTQDISYIRMPTKGKNSNVRRCYEAEMTHFRDKRKQSTIEGVGIINNYEDDYKKDLNIFNEICNMLVENRGHNPDLLIDDEVYGDASLIKDLKEISIKNYKNIMSSVRNSCLGHACSFVSRLAHSLMFYSQLPFSGDYVRVDNLGYKNCLLMVKGGKKIFKSKSSKLYRIIYPISDKVVPWYINGHRDKGSFRFYTSNGITYALTPWSMLHESILTDSISFYPRVTSFVFLNLNPKIELKQQFHKVSINVLLSFHNRRKTEVMLANMRYILLSTLGDFTGITQILKEFFDFNYDRFQSFIRNCILINYPQYFNTLKSLKEIDIKHDSIGKASKREINLSDFVRSRLKNIFTGSIINSTEDLALMIYSTFLMTKAPYQKLVERSNNLKGILEINEYYKESVGVDLTPEEQTMKLGISNITEGLESYSKSIFSNDFNFDPKFCANVGGFIDGIYERQNDTEDIETSWLRILNKPWDEMATSTGLRGDYDKVEDFWGQKGYFVIYKELLNTPGFSEKLDDVLNSRVTDDDKRKILRTLNEVYSQKLNLDREFLIFHAVDKVQWRGGREIYVMDLYTKTLQQPIEQFMAVLCRKLDNELISIPSDRRAQVIHHSIFEKDLPGRDTLTWYLTLDCSKWAPKSVFIKFIIVILNMRCIPNSFKTHFMNYIDKLYKKRIYFNKGEVEVLMKNPKYTDLCKRNLIEDKNVGGYYMNMPYSWVMGIFNYTSSFLHAANQKYLSYILMKTSIISYSEETSLVMFAHSDDSGGRLSVSSIKLAQRALIIYEIFLKSCNHILSKKKSVVSRIYFEILSVIYLFNKLLALLPKFLGGLRFLPTDKGPAQDMLQSYSKCIEVIVAGGDFQTAYIVMKVYSMLIWRFYFNRMPTALDYDRPVQYLGMPDAHPLFVLLCGSDADILRLFRNKVNLTGLVTFVNTFTSTMDSEGPIKPLKFEIKVKGIKRGFEDYLDIFQEHLKSWSIRNVNYHNTGLNALSFLRKLNDAGFVGSLVNESTVRRISRSYFIRIGDSSITKLGNVKLNKILDALTLCQGYTQSVSSIKQVLEGVLDCESTKVMNQEFDDNLLKTDKMLNLIKSTLKSPLKIYKYMDLLTMEGRNIIDVSRTLKPTLVQLTKSNQIFSVNFDPASLVSYIKEPDMSWALSDVRGLNVCKTELEHHMSKLGYNVEEVDPDVLLRVCRSYGRENTKNIYIYSRVPGSIRQIKTYSAFLTFLSVNSFSNKEINGLSIKLSEKEVGKEYLEPYLIEEVYTVNNILSLISMLIEKCGVEFSKTLVLNSIDDINWKGGSVDDFLLHFDTMVETDIRYSLLKAQCWLLKIKLYSFDNNAGFLNDCAYYTFIKSQKLKSGWYGKGEVYIRIERSFYSFILLNNTVDSLYCNRSGKLPLHHSEFIRDVLKDIGISLDLIKKPKASLYNKQHFGVDMTGDFSIYKGRDLVSGVPAVIIDSRGDFVDTISDYTVKSDEQNFLVLHKGYEDFNILKKVHLLPVRKAELVPTVKSLLNPKQFEDKILETGLNGFEEFIYTELLIDYGNDIVVGFEQFLDNYQSSKIYSILKEVHEKNISKINRSPSYSPLPASEGSMVRVLIDYTYHTNDRIINTPTSLDPKIMQLRAEYSDNMATILGEKLSNYHSQIYSKTEQKEISDHYHNISLNENIDSVRNSIIKLMTYWGYGSLVNSIQEFTLSRNSANYKFFNHRNLSGVAAKTYADLYPFIIKKINGLFKKWRSLFNSIDCPINSLHKTTNANRFYLDYCQEACIGVNNLVLTNLRDSIYCMQYMNILLGYMVEEEFISELQLELSQNYILSSIPISWKLRFELIATINVFKTLWQESYKQEGVQLDYLTKLQRHKDSFVHYKALLHDFDIITPPKDVHYNGFMTEELISFIMSRTQIFTDTAEYRLNVKLTSPSTCRVPMRDFLKHPAPLTREAMENELFEDIVYEYSMSPIDDDTILELFGELDKPLYVPVTTKKLKLKNKRVTTGTIKWIVCPYVANMESKMDYFRQVGENIVVITDSYLDGFRESFPNSGIRLVNPSKILKMDSKNYFVHYSFHKEFYNKDFINEYFKGQEFYYNDNIKELIKSNVIRNLDGKLISPGDQGFSDGVELLLEGSVIVEKDGYLEYVKVDDSGDQVKDTKVSGSNLDLDVYTGLTDEESIKFKRLMKVNNTIDKISDEGLLSPDTITNLRNKYTKMAIQDKIPVSLLLLSTLKESEMIKINMEVLNNTGGISANDQKRMFLAPENFGLAKTSHNSGLNPIKEKRVRAELNSIHPNLSVKVGTNTFYISQNMKKLIDANYKMWVRLNKTSKTKVENKNFLLMMISLLCPNTFVSDDDSDDNMWQEIINNTTLYLSQEEEEEDDDDDKISLIFNAIPGSRLMYKSAGF